MHNIIIVADIGFSPSVYSVEEDDGSVVFVIQNRNPNVERDVVVEFRTTDGTALGKEICALYLTLHTYNDACLYLLFCRRR